MGVLAAAVVFLSGCEGPSTKVPVRQQTVSGQEVPETIPMLEAANPFYIQDTLNRLTEVTREPGSAGEYKTQEYLSQMLESYGYQVETNDRIITAVRETDDPDSDVLIAYASYGTSPDSAGTLQSAAGTGMLLEMARLLSAPPTDTELRLVFLPGVPEALEPVRTYLQTIDSGDKSRIIGAFEAGPQGYSGKEHLILATSDGNPTLLAEQLNKSVMQLTGRILDYEPHQVTGANVFMRNRIPAVTLCMDHTIRITGTCFDTIDLVDTDALAENADAVSQAFYAFMNPDTPSMRAKSRYYNDIRDDAFTQTADAVLPFGRTREYLEQITGQSGKQVSENTDASGHQVEAYEYPMKWFGVDQVIMTRYYFQDGLLWEVEPEADSAGVDFDDMLERIQSVYGEYTGFSSTPSGTFYNWVDEFGRRSLELTPEKDGYQLIFSEYDTPRTELAPGSLAGDKLRAYAERFLPMESEGLRFSLYSDGVGATKGYVDTVPGETPQDPAVYVIALDQYDALTSIGEWINEEDTAWTLAGLYAQILASRDSRYLDEFSEPEKFVESFQWFLTQDLPEKDAGGLKKRMQYFYNFEELVSYREQFRKNLRGNYE
jgi:aminopeptidase YwaD